MSILLDTSKLSTRDGVGVNKVLDIVHVVFEIPLNDIDINKINI